MKKILFLVCALTLYAFPAFAASPTPEGWAPALQAEPGKAAPAAMPEIDYLNPKNVPLTDKEKKALRLSGSWSRQGVEPVLTGGGKVVYVHGASLPTIVAAPMQVCDVELQPGEIVHEIVVGDSSRWMVDSGTAGSGSGATAHLFIKPVDSGLESSAVVTTDRRVYHLRLVSQRSGHTPYVGFLYSESLKQQAAWKQARNSTNSWFSTETWCWPGRWRLPPSPDSRR